MADAGAKDDPLRPRPSPRLRLTATMDTNFRKIDIDQYDEDVLVDSELYEPDPRDPAQVLNDTKQKAGAVRGSLSKCVSISTISLRLRTDALLQRRYSRSLDPGA